MFISAAGLAAKDLIKTYRREKMKIYDYTLFYSAEDGKMYKGKGREEKGG